MSEYYIITTAHKSIWPTGSKQNSFLRGVLLFWAANSEGYSSFLERAGRYSEAEAKEICKPRDSGIGPQEFMVPCEVVDASAVRVVDLDLLPKLTAPPVTKV